MGEQSIESQLQRQPGASNPLDPEEQFLAILNNRGKSDPNAGPPREHGFVVVAEGTPSLQFLQNLCVSHDQSYNVCFTARYRLGRGPVIGTLLDAFLGDFGSAALWMASTGSLPKLQADLLPPPGPDRADSTWSQLFQTLLEVELSDLEHRPGLLTREVIEATFRALEDALGTGERLVLLCELPEHRHGSLDEDQAVTDFEGEWKRALPVWKMLPQRVGIVFGFPDDRFTQRLILDDAPHQMRLSFFGVSAPAAANIHRFKPAALAGDYPATRDAFGLEEEARAIARLVLHPQTDPMTISIEAPWGQGKSSFLNFVSRELTDVAVERVDAALSMRFFVDQAYGTGLERERVKLARPPSEDESDTQREEREASARETEKSLEVVRQEERKLWARMDRVAQREVLQVRFNAWRHQDATHIWAGLVSEVSKAVERSLPRWRRWIAPLTYALRNRASELIVGIVLPTILAIVFAVTLTLLGVGADAQELDDVPTIFKLLVPGSAILAVLAWRAYKVLQPVSQRVLDYVRLPDYRDQLGFQEQVLQDLGYLRGLLRRRRWVWREGRLALESRDPRIVVFIDDLDRCPDGKVMEVLQTVNLVLVQGGEAETGGGESNGAFVLLAVDTDKIHQAIEHHYEKQGASTADPEFAQSYLRKIIQLPYYLPEPPQGRRLSLIRGLFTPAARAVTEGDGTTDGGAPVVAEAAGAPDADGFWVARDAVLPPRVQVFTEVEDTPAELQAFSALADFLPDNPREMKRLLNVHRFVKILLQPPEAPPDDDVQRKLVAWLIFCARWEKLVDPLLDFANKIAVDPSLNCLEELEEIDETVGPFRKRLADKLETALTVEDLRRDGILAEAARRTRVLPRSPAG